MRTRLVQPRSRSTRMTSCLHSGARRAAEATGVDPAYLMALADKESSLRPDKEARTSSAEGLFQFLDDTWFEVLRRYGAKHGYVNEAKAIERVGGKPMWRTMINGSGS